MYAESASTAQADNRLSVFSHQGFSHVPSLLSSSLLCLFLGRLLGVDVLVDRHCASHLEVSSCRLIVRNLRSLCSSPHTCSSEFSVFPSKPISSQIHFELATQQPHSWNSCPNDFSETSKPVLCSCCFVTAGKDSKHIRWPLLVWDWDFRHPFFCRPMQLAAMRVCVPMSSGARAHVAHANCKTMVQCFYTASSPPSGGERPLFFEWSINASVRMTTAALGHVGFASLSHLLKMSCHAVAITSSISSVSAISVLHTYRL